MRGTRYTARRATLGLIGFVGLVLGGCNGRSPVCGGGPGTAIRLRAKDAQTGAVILNPTVSAIVVGEPGAVVFTDPLPGDSTVTRIQGEVGLYEVTVKKAGYMDVTQRVTVSGGTPCSGPPGVDLSVTMQRQS